MVGSGSGAKNVGVCTTRPDEKRLHRNRGTGPPGARVAATAVGHALEARTPGGAAARNALRSHRYGAVTPRRKRRRAQR